MKTKSLKYFYFYKIANQKIAERFLFNFILNSVNSCKLNFLYFYFLSKKQRLFYNFFFKLNFYSALSFFYLEKNDIFQYIKKN